MFEDTSGATYINGVKQVVPTFSGGQIVQNSIPDANSDNFQYSNLTFGDAPTATVQTTPQYTSGQSSLLSSLPTKLQDIYSSSMANANKAGNRTTLFNQGQDWLQSQNALNQRGVQNEMAMKSGRQGILGMISRGLQAGGRSLAQGNAGSSSAAGELAKIYGKIGQQEMSKVGNQYGLANQQIGTDQGLLDTSMQNFQNVNFKNQKEDLVNGIVEAARTQLNALNDSLIGASLPDRIAIEDEINKVKSGAQGELAKLDSYLAEQMQVAQGAKQGVDMNRTKAVEAMQMGQSPASQFDYRTEVPVNWLGAAPSGGNLPIFTYSGKKKTSQVA